MDNIIWIGSLEVGTGQWLGKGVQYNLDGLTGGGHWAVARVDNIIWMDSPEVGTGQWLGKGGNIIWMDSLEVGIGQLLDKGGQYNLDGLIGRGQ